MGKKGLKEEIIRSAKKGYFKLPDSGIEWSLNYNGENLSLVFLEISKYPNGKAEQVLESREEVKNVLNGLVRPNLPVYFDSNWMPSLYTGVIYFNGKNINYGKEGLSLGVHIDGFFEEFFKHIPSHTLDTLIEEGKKICGVDIRKKIKHNEFEYIYGLLTEKSHNMDIARWSDDFLEAISFSYLMSRLQIPINLYPNVRWKNPLRQNQSGFETDVILAYYGKGIQRIKNCLIMEKVTVS